ncbi:hypothetical protein ACQ4PT_057458 [Festuca glaucescens]
MSPAHPSPPPAHPCSDPEGSPTGGVGVEMSKQRPCAVWVGPGISFLRHVLASFHSPVSVSPANADGDAAGAEVWITPPFQSPWFSPSSIESLLAFFFCPPPSLLRVSQVAPALFRVCVACSAVADFVVAVGEEQTGKFGLRFHASLAVAMDAVHELPARAPPVKRRRRRSKKPRPPWARYPVDSRRSGGPPLLPTPCTNECAELCPPAAVTSYETSTLAAPVPATGPSAAPSPRGMDSNHVAASIEPNASVMAPPPSPAPAPSTPLTPRPPTSFNAMAPRSYLEALLTPASPPSTTPRTPPLFLSLDGCFRCLSPRHQVRDCRDPVRCHGCGRSGHRVRECTMPSLTIGASPSADPAPAVTLAPRRPTPWPAAPNHPLLRPRVTPTRLFAPLTRSLSADGASSSWARANLSPPRPASPPVRDVLETPTAALEPAPTMGAAGDIPGAGSDEETVESDAASVPRVVQVFMPPGDTDAVLRLAVVYIERDVPFSSPAGPIFAALFDALPHLHVTMVPSPLGDMYARFLSQGDREIAMARQPFFHDGATFHLVRAELADRLPSRPKSIALLRAGNFPEESVNPSGVAAAFCKFGLTLEVDPVNLSGQDLSSVRAVVLLDVGEEVPEEVHATGVPWGTRIISIAVVRVWPAAESYDPRGSYVPFYGPPPFPVSASPHPALRRPSAAALASSIDTWLAERGGHMGARSDAEFVHDGGHPHDLLLALLDSVASSSGAASPGSTLSSVTITWTAGGGSDGDSRADSLLGSRPPIMDPLRYGAVISEIVHPEPVPTAAAAAAAVDTAPVVRASHRLADKAPQFKEDTTSCAVKLRSLRDTLRSCTSVLQKKVSQHKLLDVRPKPLGEKALDALTSSVRAQSSTTVLPSVG